jgi:vancomycin resistance protein YoaR
LASREYTIYATVDRHARRRTLRRRRRLRQGVTLIAIAVPAALGAQALATQGQVVPGVSVAGVDLGGLSQSAARARLAPALAARLTRPLTVHTGAGDVDVVPADAGIGVDIDRTVSRAFAAGRVEERLLPYVYSSHVTPVLTLPAKAGLPRGIVRLQISTRSAALVVDGTTVRVKPAVEARIWPAAATLRAIGDAALRGDREVTIAPRSEAAPIPTAAAERAAADARTLLAAPVALRFHGRRLGTLPPATLAPLVRAMPDGANGYRLALDRRGLAAALQPHVASIERAPRDATWRTDGTRARVVAAVAGYGVDPRRTGAEIVAAGLAGGRVATVRLQPVQPGLTTQAAKALGIRTRVTTVTTDLGDSSANRIWNVRLMAQILDGQVIRPGQVFDFNERVGNRTADRGFREGQAIVGGLLIPSIGGGVCQVATTVFDAAFYGGYPVLERTNHSFYISHYAMGMDATVSWGGPDLRFRNDSAYGILIKTAASSSNMTVTFYSTDRGISVSKETGTPHDQTPAKPRYILNPALGGKQSSQKSSGEGGFTVSVQRVVRRHGKVVRRDSFTSVYTPDPILYVVGKKFAPPAGATVETAPPDYQF